MSAEEEKDDSKSERWEIMFGLVLAVFAAILAVCDLGGGKYGDDQILAANDRANAYAWYQNKGVKETLVEGQANFLEAMVSSGVVAADKADAVTAEVEKLRAKVERYSKEKKEILLGSKTVGQENWAQDIDGKMGQVIGAKEYEATANQLDKAGNIFDMGTLYLQMCLVIGAIGIIVRNQKMKSSFFGAMIVLGLLGSYYTWKAYQAAWAIG